MIHQEITTSRIPRHFVETKEWLRSVIMRKIKIRFKDAHTGSSSTLNEIDPSISTDIRPIPLMFLAGEEHWADVNGHKVTVMGNDIPADCYEVLN